MIGLPVQDMKKPNKEHNLLMFKASIIQCNIAIQCKISKLSLHSTSLNSLSLLQ